MAFSDTPLDFLHAEIVKYAQEREAVNHEEKLRLTRPTLEKKIFLTAEKKLELIGHGIGLDIVRKMTFSDTPSITSELEMMKFICKGFWTRVFGKQASSLRTNHHGAYIIKEERMSVLTPFPKGVDYIDKVNIYLALPRGIILGAIRGLEVDAEVTSAIKIIPSVIFNIQITTPFPNPFLKKMKTISGITTTKL